MTLKQTDVVFEVYQLDAYHYRIEIWKNSSESSNIYSHAVFYLPLRELYIQHDVRRELLEAILEFVEKEFGKVEDIIKCIHRL